MSYWSVVVVVVGLVHRVGEAPDCRVVSESNRAIVVVVAAAAVAVSVASS